MNNAKTKSIQLSKLRVKIKSLADESRTIRSEARKFHGMERWDLNHHRTWDVRNEARATLLAYAYLRGKPCPEHRVNDPAFYRTYILHRVKTMVKKYGGVEFDPAWHTGLEPAEECVTVTAARA